MRLRAVNRVRKCGPIGPIRHTRLMAPSGTARMPRVSVQTRCPLASAAGTTVPLRKRCRR